MDSVLSLSEVTVHRSDKIILGPIDWQVKEGERWIVIGPNGAGKTTLFNLGSSQLHPTSGSVEILGSKMGSVDVFELRTRIGLMSSNIEDYFPQDEIVLDVVLTAAYAILGRWNEPYELWDESRAQSLLTTLGVRELAERKFFTLSEGEKKRVLIARALMANPEILFLDEPASGLDLGGREDLLKRLDSLARDPLAPATLIITHHIEEIPAGTTHALLLKDGLAVAKGEIDSVINSQNLSIAYGLPIEVIKMNGRFAAKIAS